MKNIYVLKHPETLTPFYVGSTNNVVRRLRGHLCGNTSETCMSLVKNGIKPIIEVLEQVPDKMAVMTEYK